jgi:hypothetical protein
MNPGMFGYVGQSSGAGVKSIQRGTVTATTAGATVTIAAVNTSKALLNNLGGSGVDNASSFAVTPRLVLTNATTITAWCESLGPAGAIVSWEMMEYF